MRRRFALALLAALAAPTPAWAATLEVTVGNLRSSRGTLRVSVCTEETFLAEFCGINANVKAAAGELVVTFPDMPPGTYAVQAHLDEDDDARIGRTLLGIPKEGIGVSNDVPFRFRPPRFGDAAFRLDAAGGSIRLNLRYFD